MVLELIFGFLTGVAFIVLIAYITKNRRLGLSLINKDVILSTLLVIVLLFLTLQQYIIAILIFIVGGLLFLYFVKNKETTLAEIVTSKNKLKETDGGRKYSRGTPEKRKNIKKSKKGSER